MINVLFFNRYKVDVVLRPGDKECLFLVNLVVKPIEVCIALIHDVIRTGFNRDRIKDVYIMYIRIGDIHIDWY
ncbi:hypothetical protein SDC9_176774 [bioreactor metagenome]|uniref:Uncharacterized protein n=1 Tax=bioreactor metagenome TaxID=1076179 RepID=A0A645GTM5_9ZZZZ